MIFTYPLKSSCLGNKCDNMIIMTIDCDKKRRGRDEIILREVISSNLQTLGINANITNKRTHRKN